MSTKKIYAIAPLLFVIATLVGCASNQPKLLTTDNTYQTQQEVDSSMAQAVQGINNSLKTLTSLDRGNLVAPDKGPLRTSVAYDLNTKDVAPIAVDMPKTTPLKGTHSYDNKVVMDEQLNTDQLAKKVKITWDGSASELLRQISTTIGFSYFTSGQFVSVPSVKLDTSRNGDTVEHVLKSIADQISSSADVNVNVSPVGVNSKSISLAYKTTEVK